MASRTEPDGPTGGDDGTTRWGRLGRGVLRYAVGYAGVLVVLATLLFDSDLVLVGVVGLGCFLLLLAAGGDRGTRTVYPGSRADRLFEAGTVESDARPGAGLSRAARYVLTGVGLILGGVVALLLT